MKKSNADYFICENPDTVGCKQLELVLEADGRSNLMSWSLKGLKPNQNFCNWKIKVKGINPITSALDDVDLSKNVVKLSVTSEKAAFSLVSAADKMFDFAGVGDENSMTYASMTLERAA